MMKRRTIFQWILFLCLFLVLPSLDGTVMAESKGNSVALSMKIPSGTLTLLRAQQKALDASPTIGQALARIQEAQAVVDQSRASLLPTLSLHTGYRTQQGSIRPDWLPEQRVRESYQYWSAGIQAGWLVFDGFSRRARILAAEHKAESALHDRDETRRLLADAVATAFYQTQLTQEKMLIAQQNQVFNRSLEQEAIIRWQAGSIAEADNLNFAVRALQAESDFLIAERQFKITTCVLAELMALPNALLSEALIPVRNNLRESLKTIPSYHEEFAYALSHHPRLQALKSSISALKQKKLEEKGRYWPKVIVKSGFEYHQYDDMGTIDQEEHDAYAGLDLAWDIYLGGERDATIRITESQIRETRNQQRQQVLAIQSDIQQAIETATASCAIYQRQQRTLTLTARIREHIKKSYRAGLTTISRINEAQNDLIQAAGAEATSRINYQHALQQLEAASGRILAKNWEL